MRRPRKYRNAAVIGCYLDGDSAAAIGKVFGITDTMVLWILRRYGIPRRPSPVRRQCA